MPKEPGGESGHAPSKFRKVMKPTPILFLSDSPEQPTGLARISRDLAVQLSREPQFRVGFLGLRGWGSRHLPFPVYQIQEATGMWGQSVIHKVWEDFAGDERGIIFTVWDISRTAYLTMPELVGSQGASYEFLKKRRFRLWGYFPVDAVGPRGRFQAFFQSAYLGYNRRLFYTRWARDLAQESLGQPDDWIPHGLNLATWTIQDKQSARKALPHAYGDDFILGCVATNQARKDWGLVFAVARQLCDILKGKVHLWGHTDTLLRDWNIPQLIDDFGLSTKVTISTQASPPELATLYNACDVTIAPGLGEGFGFPIAESLACGTPVVHGRYGGGAELIHNQHWLIEPAAWRLDGEWGCVRPVFTPEAFAEAAMSVTDTSQTDCRAMVEHLSWGKLWKGCWRKWFLRGLVSVHT